jgi:hypothetical protein
VDLPPAKSPSLYPFLHHTHDPSSESSQAATPSVIQSSSGASTPAANMPSIQTQVGSPCHANFPGT